MARKSSSVNNRNTVGDDSLDIEFIVDRSGPPTSGSPDLGNPPQASSGLQGQGDPPDASFAQHSDPRCLPDRRLLGLVRLWRHGTAPLGRPDQHQRQHPGPDRRRADHRATGAQPVGRRRRRHLHLHHRRGRHRGSSTTAAATRSRPTVCPAPACRTPPSTSARTGAAARPPATSATSSRPTCTRSGMPSASATRVPTTAARPTASTTSTPTTHGAGRPCRTTTRTMPLSATPSTTCSRRRWRTSMPCSRSTARSPRAPATPPTASTATREASTTSRPIRVRRRSPTTIRAASIRWTPRDLQRPDHQPGAGQLVLDRR